jgi:chromosome segregation ATPase
VLALLEEIKKRMEKLEDENRELKDENKRLREDLKELERRRQEERFESFEKELRELKEGQNRLRNQYDVAIHMINTVKDVLITGMKPVETRPPPKETARATPTEEELKMLGIPFEEE